MTAPQENRLFAYRDAERAVEVRDENLATLRAVPDRAEAARLAYADALNAAYAIDKGQKGTEAVETAFTRARDDVKATLAALRAEATRAAAAVHKWIDDHQEAADVNAQLLREMQESRAWQRTRGQLDGGRPVEELISEAREAGDVPTLRAMAAELPAWADADPDRAFRAGVMRSEMPLTVAAIDRALVDVLPAGEGKLAKLRLAVADAEPAAVAAVEHADRAAEHYTIEPAIVAAQSDPQPPRALSSAWMVAEIEANESQSGSYRGGSRRPA